MRKKVKTKTKTQRIVLKINKKVKTALHLVIALLNN